MKTKLISSIVLFCSILGSAAMAHAQTFVPDVLSDPGKQAYKTLVAVDLFALGGTGYGGDTSKGEEALDVLIREEHAVAAFKHLITESTPEGALYALLGLKILKCDCFVEEYQRFVKRPEPGERKSWGRGVISAGNVNRMAGCIGFQEPRLKVAEAIAKETDEVKWKLGRF